MHYDDYTEARDDMLEVTHTEFAPWTLVEFDDQQVGRLTLLRDFLDRVPDIKLPLARGRLAEAAQEAVEGDLRGAGADRAVPIARRDRQARHDL